MAGEPGRQVVWHHVPGAACTQHIEDTVDDVSVAVLARASCFAFSLWRRQEGLNDGPLLIGETRWVQLLAHAASLPKPTSRLFLYALTTYWQQFGGEMHYETAILQVYS